MQVYRLKEPGFWDKLMYNRFMGEEDENFGGQEIVLTEEDKQIVAENALLLDLRLTGRGAGELFGLQDQIRQDATAIKYVGKNYVNPEVLIIYNTATGKIQKPEGLFGKFSALRVHYSEKGGGKTIFPSQARKSDSGEARGQAVPERISAEYPTMPVEHERWGQSKYVESARGDFVILQSVRAFNESHKSPEDQPS